MQQERLHNKVMMKPPPVLNKAPNPIQITAEQLLKDAEIHRQDTLIVHDERILDEAELSELKL